MASIWIVRTKNKSDIIYEQWFPQALIAGSDNQLLLLIDCSNLQVGGKYQTKKIYDHLSTEPP